MQLRFFSVPILGGQEAADELNQFLAGHRILAIDRQLARDGATSVWAICISYEPAGDSRPPASKRGKVDYREILNEADFTLYARLRSLRKEFADQEGMPVYALCLVTPLRRCHACVRRSAPTAGPYANRFHPSRHS